MGDQGSKLKAKSSKLKGQRAEDGGQRQGLLAKVHIAPKELGLSDEVYHDILWREFRKTSAKYLSILELQYLVALFEETGWRPKTKNNKPSQVSALRARVTEIAEGMENSERRLSGLCRKLCGTERLEWCRDAGKLKRLLMALEKIKEKEAVGSKQ